MSKNNTDLRLLIVDDEEEFRSATSKTLGRRGYHVIEAASGEEALAAIRRKTPDVVLLDLKMPGMDGIETLQEIRKIEPRLPVIILTGHGDYDAAVTSIKLEVVDFLQKPVDVEQLSRRIRTLLERDGGKHLRERTIAELMVPPTVYPRLYLDQPMAVAFETLRNAFFRPISTNDHMGQIRSVLVYDRDERFVGVVRFVDLLKLVLPQFLRDSPYASYFTGMFLAQSKVIGKRDIRELLGETVFVDVGAPLMEAVHLMVKHSLINLPVMKERELVGLIRAHDVVLEIARNMGVE